jgi:D-alanyl-D-alanine carboxypeptidase
MKNKLTESFFQETAQKMLKNKSVFGAVLCVEKGDSSLAWAGGVGNIKTGDRYFIASVTKLYVTALMLMLRAENRLDFSDKMHEYFPGELIGGIHVIDGVDYTKEITLAHLLSNTSGIPDYFYYEKPKGEAAADLIKGMDQPWPLNKALQRVKTLKPKFKPGQKGKVNYSDTNYQLLGGIIEKVTGKGMGDVFREYIFQPLNLKDTYAFHDVNDTIPVPFYFKSRQVHAPNYMASVTAEGGIVSTAQESMAFIKAFFNGFFFPREVISELKETWNMIFFPGQFYFGLGLEKLWIPRIFSPLKPIGEVLGFWGQTGAFAFYNPETDLYFTGTINQASGLAHSAAFNAILKIIKSV